MENTIEIQEDEYNIYNIKEAEALVLELSKFRKENNYKKESLLTSLLDYAYENDLDVHELGEVLSYHEDFKTILHKELQKNNYTKDYKETGTLDEGEW
jgi:hypothetical protein